VSALAFAAAATTFIPPYPIACASAPRAFVKVAVW
jgi:hypothetical protein